MPDVQIGSSADVSHETTQNDIISIARGKKSRLPDIDGRPITLFSRRRLGTPMNPSNMRAEFNRMLEAADMPKIRFHDLRHTTASPMFNHRVPVIVVSQMLGHSKPSVTFDIYAHLYNEMQDEAARVMVRTTTFFGKERRKNRALKPPTAHNCTHFLQFLKNGDLQILAIRVWREPDHKSR